MTGIRTKNAQELRDRLVSLTRDLILIPSIPSRPEDQRRCYEFIKNHLDDLEHVEVKEYEKNGFPSLVALPSKIKKPKIMMCGHLDVIAHPEEDVYKSHIKDGRIYGPGAGDMKGSVAILMEVFRSIHAQIPRASLALAITSDEETGGESGIGYLFGELGWRCDEAMIPDGGSLNEITIEEKGILHVRVSCAGTPAHAARPWLGDNPIDRLFTGLVRIRDYFETFKQSDGHWYPTCAVTVIDTENKTVNRIPMDASAVLDIRFPPPFKAKKLLKDLQQVLGDDYDIDTIISAEPTQLSPDPLFQQITEKVTGRPAKLVKDDGGSDGRFVAAHKIPVVMSRPLVGNLHAKNEWIDIDSMVKMYLIYEEFLRAKLSK